jgi:tol-pal system protein YbgF
VLLAPFACVAFTACSTTGGVEQEVSRLRQEMRALRAELAEESQAREALETRVTLLTSGRRSATASPSPRASDAQSTAHSSSSEPTLPDLPVVKLPGEAHMRDGLGAVDDGGAPVMIRLGAGGGEERLSVDHSVLQKPDPVLGAAQGSNTSSEKSRGALSMNEHYALALSKLRQENNPRAARELLLDFLERYASSHLSSNAAYWLGECSFAEKNYARAAGEFERVLTGHPDSAKVPDAMLRLALSWKRLGKQTNADEVARRLVSEHPDSEAAKQVPDQIGPLRG